MFVIHMETLRFVRSIEAVFKPNTVRKKQQYTVSKIQQHCICWDVGKKPIHFFWKVDNRTQHKRMLSQITLFPWTKFVFHLIFGDINTKRLYDGIPKNANYQQNLKNLYLQS